MLPLVNAKTELKIAIHIRQGKTAEAIITWVLACWLIIGK